ncbi:ABC transporter permease subunit [Spiroplasma endosymbiont of Amphibalanus improvisus]|uniref:phosphate ABC transporter permease n=1 Tax=Spiroplasma endosymbiont of Amphibalanus improvisus TaxID=3066327 RepID=UPI00313C383E
MKNTWNKVCNKINFKIMDIKSKLVTKKGRRDFAMNSMIKFSAFLIIAILITLVSFIIFKSIYFFSEYGFINFIAGSTWNVSTDEFGIWKIIISTFFILAISLLIAVPIAIYSSLFIVEYLKPKTKRITIGVIQLLAGIPSIIFGLFALSTIGVLFQDMGAPTTSNLIVTCITLAFMALPIMISLSVHAIESVPRTTRYGTMSLGFSKTFTTFKIVYRQSKLKIITAIMMGIARIIGETTAVMMICGNNPNGPDMSNGFIDFLFSSVSSLASMIGLEMLENSGPLHESALYAIGLILFIIVTLINLIVLGIQSANIRKINSSKKNNNFQINSENTTTINKKYKIYSHKYTKRRKWIDYFLLSLMIMSTVLVVSFTMTIVISILWQGLFMMQWADLISTSTANGGAGILASTTVSILLVICSLFFAFPIALGVAIYLNEYASSQNKFANGLRFSINVISSTPSIVFGTFGLAFFIGFCKIPLSIFAASLTLTIVVLPMMIRNIEDGLSFIPQSVRNSSYALGLSKAETIRKVVLRNASGAILTSVVLSTSRVLGESAPVYLTLGTAVRMPVEGFLSPGASITTQILMLWKTGTDANSVRVMYELGFVMMFMILSINLFAAHLQKRILPDYKKISLRTRIKDWKDYYWKPMIGAFFGKDEK